MVNEVDTHKTSAIGYMHRDYDPVPGGQRVAVDLPDTSEVPTGTLMGTFNSDEYGDGWVTAGHVLEGGDNFVTEVISSENDMEALGYSRDVIDSGNVDIGFIEHDGQLPEDSITRHDNSSIDMSIGGIYTDSALDYHAGEGTLDVEMQGQTSGRKSGEVKKTLGSPTKGVVVGNLMDEGDSGGPMFVDHGSATMVGAIAGGYRPVTIWDEWTWGTTAETIEEELGGQIY